MKKNIFKACCGHLGFQNGHLFISDPRIYKSKIFVSLKVECPKSRFLVHFVYNIVVKSSLRLVNIMSQGSQMTLTRGFKWYTYKNFTKKARLDFSKRYKLVVMHFYLFQVCWLNYLLLIGCIMRPWPSKGQIKMADFFVNILLFTFTAENIQTSLNSKYIFWCVLAYRFMVDIDFI